MKRLLVTASLVLGLFASQVRADIPAEPSEVKSLDYSGDAAKALYDSIAGEGVAGRGRVTIKSVRAQDGLFQITCNRVQAPSDAVLYDCLVEVSLTGTKLPARPAHNIRG